MLEEAIENGRIVVLESPPGGIFRRIYCPGRNEMESGERSLSLSSTMSGVRSLFLSTSERKFWDVKNSGGSSIFKVPCVITWQLSLIPSERSLSESFAISASVSGPESPRIFTLHNPQVPILPQADGRCIPWTLRTSINFWSSSTLKTLAPQLISIVAIFDLDSLDLKVFLIIEKELFYL